MVHFRGSEGRSSTVDAEAFKQRLKPILFCFNGTAEARALIRTNSHVFRAAMR
jgi:hypothetical protein